MQCPKCKANTMADHWDYLTHRFKCFICGCTTGHGWHPYSLERQIDPHKGEDYDHDKRFF